MRLFRSRDGGARRAGRSADRRACLRSLAGVAVLLSPLISVGCSDTDGPVTIELACSKDWTVRWSDSTNPYRAVIDSDIADRPLEQYLSCVKVGDRAGWARASNPPKGWDAEFVLPNGKATRGGRTDGSASVRIGILAPGAAAPAGFPAANGRSRLIAEVSER